MRIVRREEVLSVTDHQVRSKANRWIYPLMLALTLFVVILCIEAARPYFFLQDDNRDYYLPYLVHNFDSLMAGELAQYNFHQFMGTPSLAMGQTAALYPFAYMAVALSRLFFGHVFASADILVIFHLLVGGVGMYTLASRVGATRPAAFFAGLTWPLSSFVFFVSNSWIVVAAVAAYMPFMLLFAILDYRKPSWKYVAGGIVVRLLLFYNGHIQYFIYSVIFEWLTMAIYVFASAEKGQKIKSFGRYFLRIFLSYLVVLALSLPLLLPMWNAMRISLERNAPLSYELFSADSYEPIQLFLGFFFPFIKANSTTQAYFRNLLNLSHIGYVGVGIVVCGAIQFIVRIRNTGKRALTSARPDYVAFSIAAFIALIWSSSVLFNRLIYLIPILNRFRWSFKLAFYLDFFLILIAALVFSSFLTQFNHRVSVRRVVFLVFVGLQIANFIFLYAVMPYKEFGERHGDPIPLEEPLKEELRDGRVAAYGFKIWTRSEHNDLPHMTAAALSFNYATIWKLNQFAGYEPLLPQINAVATLYVSFSAVLPEVVNKEDARERAFRYFAECGVRWYVVYTPVLERFQKEHPDLIYVPEFSDDYRSILRDDRAKPLVHTADETPIDLVGDENRANTLEILVPDKAAQTITFRYVVNPYLKAYADGRPISIRKVREARFEVDVPDGTDRVIIKYSDPYFSGGCYISAVLLAMGALSAVGIQIVKSKKSKPGGGQHEPTKV